MCTNGNRSRALTRYMFNFFLSIGLSKEFPVLNCQDHKLKVPAAASGVYWIDPDGGSHGNHERTDKALTVSIVSRRVFSAFLGKV